MNRMLPRFGMVVAIATLMSVTSGCVSKSDYDAKVDELKAQAKALEEKAGAQVKVLEGEAKAAKEAAKKKAEDGRRQIRALERRNRDALLLSMHPQAPRLLELATQGHAVPPLPMLPWPRRTLRAADETVKPPAA